MDPTAPLVKQISSTKEELIASFTTPAFYIEVIGIVGALAIAWLVAILVQRRMKHQLFIHPPKRIDAEFISKPLELLAPLLALVYLSVLKPIILLHIPTTGWIDAVSQLCVAYMMAKCVLLVLGRRAISYFIAFIIMAIAVLDVTGFSGTMTTYLNAMTFEVGKFKISMLNLIHGLVILVIVFWVAGLLSRTLESYLRRSSSLSYSSRELTVKFFRIFVYFVAFLVTLSAMGVDLTAFAVFGGALGVGIGLGLQKITANFVSGITLLLEKSIKIGDLIEVGGINGFVRQLNIRYALIETSDGRELLVPNEELISTRVTNWTYSNENARIEIRLTLDYNADAAQARAIMLDAARKHPRSLKSPEPLCHLRDFSDLGLVMVLLFWIPDIKDGSVGCQSDVMFTILEKFREAGIRFADKDPGEQKPAKLPA